MEGVRGGRLCLLRGGNGGLHGHGKELGALGEGLQEPADFLL